jgi:fatty-acid peroxygenase
MPSYLPWLKFVDSTATLLREGYGFIGSRCDEFGTDGFRCRLMLKKAVCLRGNEAAEAFFVPDRFTRRGAIPKTSLTLLQDKGSVQTLDGEHHNCRKSIFLSLMSPESIATGASLFAEEWARMMSGARDIVLLDSASLILCRAALRWCGLDGELRHAERLAADCMAMIDGAGGVGWTQVRGQIRRRHAEAWARRVIRTLRKAPPGATPASVIAHARDLSGKLLSTKVAAVELINLVRPTVAVARYVVFAAHALHAYPEWRGTLNDPVMRRAFAQEVRRFYPFFPFIGGRVLEPFRFAGRVFSRREWVILDVFGTNRHRSWGDPDAFRPQRWIEQPHCEGMIVAQGGGDYAAGHRCPGEPFTVALLSTAVHLLSAMRYAVPAQDLTIPLDKMPTAPRSGFRIRLGA